VRAVFVVEQREDVLLDNMLARARGISEMSAADLRTEARAKSLFARWLRDECERIGVPVVESRPWHSLVDRILAVVPESS
jgi:hypothetical protein